MQTFKTSKKQGKNLFPWRGIEFITTRKVGRKLTENNFMYNSNKTLENDNTTGNVIKDEVDPANIYLLKVYNRNTRARCEICSKLIIKTAERQHQLLLTNCLSVFDHFVGLALKGLTHKALRSVLRSL